MDPLTISTGVLGLILLFLVGWILASLYQKCGPNQAMVISGFGARSGEHGFKIIKGGGDVVLPLLQQRSFLSLEIMTIEVHSQAPIITKTGVPIFVEGVAQVKVAGDTVSIATAAEQFLGKSNEEVANVAHETLVGHLRAILGTMEVEQLIQSFNEFAGLVQKESVPDLNKMGLTVVSFTIKEIKDSVGYLEALGRKQTAEAKKAADIGVAQAGRDTAIAQAQSQRDAAIAQAQAAEEGAKAKLQADTRVAEASKNFQVNQAKYQMEVATQKAESDMAYDIVKAQQQQTLVVENQKIKIVEMEKQVELQNVEVQRREVELQAQITKPAEAEQTRVRLIAEAQAQKLQLEAKGQAEATKLRALADAEAAKALGLGQAEAEKAKGLAQAEIIKAQGQAEADAMQKRAESFKLYNQAAVASMLMQKLPEVVSAAAEPISKIGNLTVLATGGDSAGASKITSEVLNVAAQGLTMVKGLTGYDLSQALKANNQENKEGNSEKS
jgi:flotillin